MSEASDPSQSTEGKTDDLLAQLAGEEVDRLLAEADVSQAAPTQETDQIEEQEAAALTSMLEESALKELENLGQEETAAPVESPALTPEAQATEAQEDLSAQLDRLFATLTTPKNEAPEEQTPDPVKAAVLETSADNGAVAVEEKTALEQGEENGPTEQLDETLPVEKPLAWWGRPLAWINSPFDFLSENVREKLGWIGVQTIVFALLILAYVWWLRGKK